MRFIFSCIVFFCTNKSKFKFVLMKFSIYRSGWSCSPTPYPPSSFRPLAENTAVCCRSASTHLHPQLDLSSTHHSHSLTLYSTLLPAAWSIYRPCFISTPAGRQSCHSGPTEPLWNSAQEWKCTLLMQELILVTLSQQTRTMPLCCGCAVQYVVQR